MMALLASLGRFTGLGCSAAGVLLFGRAVPLTLGSSSDSTASCFLFGARPRLLGAVEAASAGIVSNVATRLEEGAPFRAQNSKRFNHCEQNTYLLEESWSPWGQLLSLASWQQPLLLAW